MKLYYYASGGEGKQLFLVRLEAEPGERAAPLTLFHAPAILAVMGKTAATVDETMVQVGVVVNTEDIPDLIERLHQAAQETEASWKRYNADVSLSVEASDRLAW